MVFLTDLARHLSVRDSTMDAVVHIASIVAGEDFAAERTRTMDTTGLSGLTREQLRDILIQPPDAIARPASSCLRCSSWTRSGTCGCQKLCKPHATCAYCGPHRADQAPDAERKVAGVTKTHHRRR